MSLFVDCVLLMEAEAMVLRGPPKPGRPDIAARLGLIVGAPAVGGTGGVGDAPWAITPGPMGHCDPPWGGTGGAGFWDTVVWRKREFLVTGRDCGGPSPDPPVGGGGGGGTLLVLLSGFAYNGTSSSVPELASALAFAWRWLKRDIA